MNILEALEAVESGKYIRYCVDDEEDKDLDYVILQTIEYPLNDKRLIKISLNDVCDQNECPTSFENIDYEELENICLSALKSKSYKIVTEQEIFDSIKKEWSARQG